MIGSYFTQLLVAQASSITGKLTTSVQNKIDRLKLAALERDLVRSKATCVEITNSLPKLKLPIESFNRVLRSVKQLIKTIETTLATLKRLLSTINTIPITPFSPLIPIPATPSVTAPLPVTAVPAGPPYPSVGNLMRIVDVKSFATKQVELLESFLSGLSNFVNIISQRIKELQEKLKELTTEINTCQTQHSADPAIIAQINAESEDIIGFLDQEIPSNLLVGNDSYKGFTFKIIEITNETFTSKNVNRRYAVAYNSNNIETLRGKPSFATNKQILINELKFIIDNQDLVG